MLSPRQVEPPCHRTTGKTDKRKLLLLKATFPWSKCHNQSDSQQTLDAKPNGKKKHLQSTSHLACGVSLTWEPRAVQRRRITHWGRGPWHGSELPTTPRTGAPSPGPLGNCLSEISTSGDSRWPGSTARWLPGEVTLKAAPTPPAAAGQTAPLLALAMARLPNPVTPISAPSPSRTQIHLRRRSRGKDTQALTLGGCTPLTGGGDSALPSSHPSSSPLSPQKTQNKKGNTSLYRYHSISIM